MNKDFVLFHLAEAENAIRDTIADIKSDPEYEYGNFRVDIEHIYLHVNSAWNARDASENAAKECSQVDFDRWRQFPTDIEIISE
jgi:hypothetical protein